MTKEIFKITFLYLIFTNLQVSVKSQSCANCIAPNAQCINGSCVCPANFTGNPQFQCHPINNLYCQLVNDPVLTNFANEKVKVHVLGSTRFAQFTTKRNNVNQFCDFTLFAIMERIAGKIFPKSFEFQLTFPDVNNPSVNTSFVLRLEASRQPDGSIEWQYVTDSRGSGTVVLGVTVPFNFCIIQMIRDMSGFVITTITCCGIKIGIRPFTGDSSLAPALFVEIDANNHPAFNNWSPSLEPLCLDQGSFNSASVKASTSISDPRKAMTYLANTNTLNWSYLSALGDDFSLLTNLRACPTSRLNSYFNYAWFPFTKAPFIKCISQSSQSNTNLYNFIIMTLNFVCAHLIYDCRSSKALILSSCNIAQYPYLQDFINSSCTAFPLMGTVINAPS